MSRTLKQQLGLEKDPHAGEDIRAGGVVLTRTFTSGGSAMDSSQPGFPVYHRKIANPFPLAAIAIGATLIISGAVFAGVRGLKGYNIILPIGLPLGGVGTMTASMFAFAEGNTFLANTAGTLAGLAAGVSLVFLPWTGIQAAYLAGAAEKLPGASQQQVLLAGEGALLKAVAFLFLIGFIPIFIIFLASFKTALPISLAALLIVLSFILQGVSNLRGIEVNLSRAAGGISIAVGVLLFYSALTVLLAEEGINVLPVMPLPREPQPGKVDQ